MGARRCRAQPAHRTVQLHLGNALFFLLLLTLLVTLYDRYRPLYVTRLETANGETANGQIRPEAATAPLPPGS